MLEDNPTIGDVSRLRLSPNESRLTRLLRVTLFWDPTGSCSSTAVNASLSLKLRPFQITDLCEDVNEENGQPWFSSVASKLPSRPGLSSPQSEPTELLKDSEEIFRDDEDMVVMKRSKCWWRRWVGCCCYNWLRIMSTSAPGRHQIAERWGGERRAV